MKIKSVLPLYRIDKLDKKDKDYLEETEFIVNMIHQFEREEEGMVFRGFIVCFKSFIEKLSQKIEQGRFIDSLYYYGGEGLCLNGEYLKNKYYFCMKRYLTIDPSYEDGTVFFSFVSDKRIIDKLLCN